MLGRIKRMLNHKGNPVEDDQYVIARQEFDTILLRAQVELLQRVNRLVELLEAQYGECEKGESNETTTVVAASERI